MTTIGANRRRRFAVVALLSLVLALGVVLGTAFLHKDRVQTAADARRTQYGFPLTWITQDQSAFVQAPALPTSIRLASPWQDPTSGDLDHFVLDVAIVGAVLSAVYLIGSDGASRLRRRSRPRPEALGALA